MLKKITFDGNISVEMTQGLFETYHEHTELYIDSVAYLTKDEYREGRKRSKSERIERCGYTVKDIERLKQKLDVPPLTAEQRKRIEDQRDWEDDYELMTRADKRKQVLKKGGRKKPGSTVVEGTDDT